VVLVTVGPGYAASHGLTGAAPARSELARAVNELHAAHAALIVLDFFFTAQSAQEPGGEQELKQAIASAGNVATAFFSVNTEGQYFLFGEPGVQLASRLRLTIGSVANASPLRTVPYDVSYPSKPARTWPSLAVLVAERLSGRAITSSDFPAGPAWIDFYGPPGTFQRRPFGELVGESQAPNRFRGKLVVVGVEDPTLDRYATPASSSVEMTGMEVVANQVMTVLQRFPLRSTSLALDVLLIFLLTAAVAVPATFLQARWIMLIAFLAACGYLALVQVEFDAGRVLPVAAPLVALGTLLGATGVLHRRSLVRERKELRALFAQMDPSAVAAVLSPAPHERPRITPTSVIAGYRIEASVAEGGMGAVYRATQIALDRTVALKVIRADRAEDPAFRERFVRESRLAAAIEHPNVIPIYEAGDDRGVLFIAMRFVDGVDLQERLEVGAMSVADAVAVFTQLTAAVQSTHAAGLLHLDLKPGNVLITDGDPAHVYLTDFGLAVRSRRGVDLGAGAGEAGGSTNFMAPEQITGSALTVRTDVYALGGILCALLTGEVPYPSLSEEQTFGAHLHAPPPRPSRRAPGVGEEFDDVVARAMAKSPADRYGSVSELGEAARKAAEARSSTNATPSMRQAATAPAENDGKSTTKLSHEPD